MSDCEFEIDGDEFVVQEQEIVISNSNDDEEEEEEEGDDDDIENDNDNNNVEEVDEEQEVVAEESSSSSDDDNSNSDSSSDSSSSDSDDEAPGGGVGDAEQASSDDEQQQQQSLDVKNEADDDNDDEDADQDDNDNTAADDAAASPNVSMDDSGEQNDKSENSLKNDEDDEDEPEDEDEGDVDEDDADNDDQENDDQENDDQENEDMIDENGVYKWKDFVGAKIKSFTSDEYRLFQKPFESGWKRELVIRCTGSTAEKKAGDIYYHTPDGSSKLRSYVEMNYYLKRHQNCGLVLENFTYTKQPIFRPPDEIVRNALQRGCNFVERPFMFSSPNNSAGKRRNSANQSNSNKNTSGGGGGGNQGPINSKGQSQSSNSIILGRGKRKRVLPSRYDENEFEYIPVKKGRLRDSLSNGNSQDSTGTNQHHSSSNRMSSGTKMTSQERRRALQQQLYLQIHEEQLRKQNEEKSKLFQNSGSNNNSASASPSQFTGENSGTPGSSLKIKISTSNDALSAAASGAKLKVGNDDGSKSISLLNGNSHNRRSTMNGNEYSLIATDDNNGDSELGDDASTSHADQSQNSHPKWKKKNKLSKSSSQSLVTEVPKTKNASGGPFRQPCSVLCPGRRNMLPNLMCSRCFCLFHLDCVPDGVFLKEPTVYICPNCLTPEDREHLEGNTTSPAGAVAAAASKAASTAASSAACSPSGVDDIGMEMSMDNYDDMAYVEPIAQLANTTPPTIRATTTHIDTPYPHKSSSSQFKSSKYQFSNGMSSKFGGGGGGLHQSVSNNVFPGMRSMNNDNRVNKLSRHNLARSSRDQSSIHSGYMMNGSSSAAKYGSNYARSPINSNHGFDIGASSGGSFSMGHKKQKFGTGPGTYPYNKAPINFQPSVDHVYRLAQTSRGHSVVIKDKTYPLASNGKGLDLVKNSKFLHDKQSLMNAAQLLARQQYFNTLSSGTDNHLNSAKSFEEKFNSILAMTSDGGNTPINYNSKYYKYLQKRFSILYAYQSNVSGLIQILNYLDTKDILNLRQTSKLWYQLTSMPNCYRKIRLRGLAINDWSYFSQKILSVYCPSLLDFEGVRITAPSTAASNLNSPSSSSSSSSVFSSSSNSKSRTSRNEKLSLFWHNLPLIYSNLSTVEVLKFGTIPLFVMQDLITLALSSSDCPWPLLRTLSILNLFDETKQSSDDSYCCTLDFFCQMESFKNIEHLRLDSKTGFILATKSDIDKRPELLENFLNTLNKFEQLSSLSLTSLKDLNCTEFAQLLSPLDPNKIRHLELGSCSEWFTETPDSVSSSINNESLFDQLSKFSNIVTFRLCDLEIGINSVPLVQLFESLIVIEHLTLDNLQIGNSGYSIWNSLSAIFKSLPLFELKFSSSESFTNRSIFDVCRELVISQKRSLRIVWTVTVNIDDVGHCFVPLSLNTFAVNGNSDSNYDFVKKYFSQSLNGNNNNNNNDNENSDNNGNNNDLTTAIVPTDQYQIVEESQQILVEISTLTELLNRDINLNVFAPNEPKVTVQIIPQ